MDATSPTRTVHIRLFMMGMMQHRTVLIISALICQTIITAQMLSIQVDDDVVKCTKQLRWPIRDYELARILLQFAYDQPN